MQTLKLGFSKFAESFVTKAKQRPKKSAVCIGDPNGMGYSRKRVLLAT